MYKIMRIPEKGKVASPLSMTASFNGTARKVDFSYSYSICCAITDTSADIDGAEFVAADVNAVANTVTETGHGAETGLKVQLTTTTTLPAGLSLATDYYVVVVDANTIKFSDTYAHAIAGTDIINITDGGTGTHTIVVQEELEGVLKLQASNNAFADRTNNEIRSDVVWIDIPSTEVTLDGDDDTVVWNVGDVYYEAVRLVWSRTAGQGTMSEYFVAKGDG